MITKSVLIGTYEECMMELSHIIKRKSGSNCIEHKFGCTHYHDEENKENYLIKKNKKTLKWHLSKTKYKERSDNQKLSLNI